jgi:hypothetical protein
MATITNSIGSGRDYSTVAAWVAATTGLLGTDIYRGEVYDDFDELVDITGGSTTPTSYRVLSVPVAFRHLAIPGTGPALIRNSSATNEQIIQIAEAYSRVEWLEVTRIGSVTQSAGVNRGVYLNAAHTRASHMLIHDMASRQSQHGIGHAIHDGLIAYRNIIYGLTRPAGSNAGVGIAMSAGAADTEMHIYGNTVFDCVTRGILAEAFNFSGAVINVRNNVAHSCGLTDFSFFKGTAGVVNSSHNVSGDATADFTGSDTGALINQALASLGFVDSDAGDFHLTSGSVLINAGIDLGAPYDEDIDAVAVADGDWDIGADEFVAAGGPSENLTGTLAGTSTATGAASRTVSITGTLAGSSAASGAIITGATINIAGTLAGTSTLSNSELSLDIYRTQTLAGTSTMSGIISISNTIEIAGTLAGSSVATGAVVARRQIAGTLAATSTLTGEATRIRSVTGILAGTSTLTGLIQTDGSVSLIGTLPGSSTLIGSIAQRRSIAGGLAGISTLTGVISATYPGLAPLDIIELTVRIARSVEATAQLSRTSNLGVHI